MSLKNCISVAYYILTWSYRDIPYFVYLHQNVSTSRSTNYNYLLFFIVFIFIAINHITSLKQNTLVYLDIFVKSSATACCLDFVYFFCQFQSGVYESITYKKACRVKNLNRDSIPLNNSISKSKFQQWNTTWTWLQGQTSSSNLIGHDHQQFHLNKDLISLKPMTRNKTLKGV